MLRVKRRFFVTARRPSVWIDWAEARSTMLKWNGYKMLLLERTA